MASVTLHNLYRRNGTVTRRMPSVYSKTLKNYVQQVGRILWAWNRLHGALGDAFAFVISPGDMTPARAVWHAVKADTAQRDMLRALLVNTPGIPSQLSEALEWLLDVSGKLSQHRNDVAHVPMAQAIEAGKIEVIPDMFSGDPARVDRLARPDRKAFHKKLQGDVISLSYYARAVASEIGLLMQTPSRPWTLPNRPRLRSIPPSEVPLTRSQKDRQRMRRERKHRQRASRQKGRR